jgi:hypothetical protein
MPVKKFLAFYGTQRFVTMFRTAYVLSILCATWIQLLHTFFPVSSVSIFSLYSKCCVIVRFTHQNASVLPHVCHMTSQLTPSLFDQPNTIWWGTQIMKRLVMQSSPVPCSHVSLRLIYIQHPVVKHSQCMFFPQCKIWSFTPTYSSR